MPYLPDELLDPTTFPKQWGKDVIQAIRMLDDKWKYHYPLLNYYMLKATIQDASADVDTIVGGGADESAFDPLWGETVDPALLTQKWDQPHKNPAADATENEKFYDPIEINMQARREVKETELKKLGFDQMRDVIVSVPVSLLDAAAITVNQGDYFIMGNVPYEVLQWTLTSYWKNSDLPIFIVANCQHRKLGS